MKGISILFLVAYTLICSGCLSGSFSYGKPVVAAAIATNSILITKSKDAVWKELIPEIGKTFWVINNLDKESGLINISYAGDPRKYVDCGQIYSHVSNAAGERSYAFPASISYKNYEIVSGNALLFAERKMVLDGRINIIIQEISPTSTQFSINPKFILNRTLNLRDQTGRVKNSNDIISFSSGETGIFSNGLTECVSNGALEASILGLIKTIQEVNSKDH